MTGLMIDLAVFPVRRPSTPPPSAAAAWAALDRALLDAALDSCRPPDPATPVTRLYDVRDLLERPADPALLALLRRLAPGGSGESALAGGRLIASRPPADHARLAAVLRALRLADAAGDALPTPPPDPAAAALERRLDRRLPRFDADGPAGEVLARWSRAVGAAVFVDWPALRPLGIGPESPVAVRTRDATADKVLRMIVYDLGGAVPLHAHADRDAVRVEPASATPRRAATIVYDVRPLLRSIARRKSCRPIGQISVRNGEGVSDAEDLIDALQSTVARDEWVANGGPTATAAAWSGRLFVRAPPETQRRVATALAAWASRAD